MIYLSEEGIIISFLELWPLLILAAAVSLDGFSVGITYGLRKIKLGLLPLLIISMISALAIFCTVNLGRAVAGVLRPDWAEYLGGTLLILIGGWLVYTTHSESNSGQKGVKKAEKKKGAINTSASCNRLVFSLDLSFLGIIIKILKKPATADLDHSGSISYWEAVILGLALALDALGAGLSAGLSGMSIIFFPLLIGLSKFVFVTSGYLAGKEAGNFLPDNFKIYPGIIIIVLGIFTLIF